MVFNRNRSASEESSDAPVIVLTSVSFGEVALVKSMLRSADIDHYVENELMTGYGPIISSNPAAGGMRVLVRPSDEKDAREILRTLRTAPEVGSWDIKEDAD